MVKLFVSKLCRLFCLLLLAGSLWAQEETWQTVSQMPVPVKGAQAVVNDTLIYIIGGYTDSTYAAANLIQIYDPHKNQWQIAADTLHFARYGLTAVNYRHEAIIFGGAAGNDSSLEMWNFVDPTYIYDHNINFSRQFATAQVYQNSLFIFGGYVPAEADVPYYVEYSVTSGTILNADSLGYAQAQNPVQQMSVLLLDNIFVMGGALNGVSKSINRFNVLDHSWNTPAYQLLDERAAGAAVKIDNYRFVVIGGYNETQAALPTVEEITVYNDSYAEQNRLADLNEPRSELTAAFLDSAVYVFGGKNIIGDYIASVEKLKVPASATEVEDSQANLPGRFKLYNNYPNPFNASTVIRYRIDETAPLELAVYNLLGQKIYTLAKRTAVRGSHQVRWNGRDRYGREAPSGVYFYRMTIGGKSVTKRMILLR